MKAEKLPSLYCGNLILFPKNQFKARLYFFCLGCRQQLQCATGELSEHLELKVFCVNKSCHSLYIYLHGGGGQRMNAFEVEYLLLHQGMDN